MDLKISVITILECGGLLALSLEGPPLFFLSSAIYAWG
jgi:hypothetical protein